MDEFKEELSSCLKVARISYTGHIFIISEILGYKLSVLLYTPLSCFHVVKIYSKVLSNDEIKSV